jgi:hypothetical protein
MTRKSRIDALQSLHHIIARGIAKSKIFLDATDQKNFLDRLGNILTDTKTPCYAWVMMPNHFAGQYCKGNHSIGQIPLFRAQCNFGRYKQFLARN